MRSSRKSDTCHGSRMVSGTDDMKQQLYHSLRNKGVIDNLKSQIRQKLIRELSARGLNGSEPKAEVVGILDPAIKSLIADYMHSNHLEYSLSVFVPEVGLSSDKLFSKTELIDLLHINRHSDLYFKLEDYLKNSSFSFLCALLHAVSDSTGRNFRDTDAQTDHSQPPLALSDRFNMIDKRFDARKEILLENGLHLAEDKLLRYQKELENQVRVEQQMEFSRFRETELSKMRLEERERQQTKFDAQRREMEMDYRNRLNALVEKERLSLENYQKQQEAYDRESYLRRQSLLEEVDAVRQRENGLRREQESWERERYLLKERQRSLEDELEKRAARLKMEELSFEKRLQEEVDRIRLAEETKYIHKWKELEMMETRSREETRIVEKEKEGIRVLRDQLLAKQSLFNEMEMMSYPTLKQENASLRLELDVVKNQLAEYRMNYEHEREKVETLLRERSTPSAAQVHAVATAEEARETLRRSESLWMEQRAALERRLAEELANGRALSQRYQEQSTQLEEADAEVAELRCQLMQIQQGLTARGDHFTANESPYYIATPRSARLSNYANATDYRSSLTTSRQHHLQQQQSFEQRHEMHEDSGDEPSGFEEVLAETRWRLQSLDQETDNLAKEYREFQSRLAKPYGGSLPYLHGSVVGLNSAHVISTLPSAATISTQRGGGSLPDLQLPSTQVASTRDSSHSPWTGFLSGGPLLPPSASAFLHAQPIPHGSPPSIDISTIRPSETQPPPSDIFEFSRAPSTGGQAAQLSLRDLEKAHSDAPSVIGLPLPSSGSLYSAGRKLAPAESILPRPMLTTPSTRQSTAVTFELPPMTWQLPVADEGGATSHDLGSVELLGPSEHVSLPETILSLDDTWRNVAGKDMRNSTFDDEEVQEAKDDNDLWRQRRRETIEPYSSLQHESESESVSVKKSLAKDVDIDIEKMQKYMALVEQQKRDAQHHQPRTSTPPPSHSPRHHSQENEVDLDLTADDKSLSQTDASPTSGSNGFW